MSQEQDFILELQQVQPVFLLDRKPKVAESYYVHMHTIALRARPLRSFLGDPYKIPLTKAALCASREPPSSDVKKEKKKKSPQNLFHTRIHSCTSYLTASLLKIPAQLNSTHLTYGTLKMLPGKRFQSLLCILPMQKMSPLSWW